MNPKKKGRKPEKKREEEEDEDEEVVMSAEAVRQMKKAIVEKPDARSKKPVDLKKMPSLPKDFARKPERCNDNTPNKVPCDDDVTKMSFSDDDMDMNVDFDLGMETGDEDEDKGDATDVGGKSDKGINANDGKEQHDDNDDDHVNDAGGEPDDDDDVGGEPAYDDDYVHDVGGEPDDSDDCDGGAADEGMSPDNATCLETKNDANQIHSDSSAVKNPGT